MKSFDLVTYLATIISSGTGAFLAAYFGAALAVRKRQREVAFERRLVWTEDLFVTLDELVRTLSLFDTKEEPHGAWLSTTEKAMILMNRNALYASRRAMDSLVQTGAEIVRFRELVRKGGTPEGLLQQRERLIEHVNASLDVLAFDAREHLGLADRADQNEFRGRRARLVLRRPPV